MQLLPTNQFGASYGVHVLHCTYFTPSSHEMFLNKTLVLPVAILFDVYLNQLDNLWVYIPVVALVHGEIISCDRTNTEEIYLMIMTACKPARGKYSDH